MFVTFEGVDWSGKSTQAELLAAWLREEGRTVLATREPGGTAVGEAVRQVVLHGHDMTPWAEAALYAAARADHVEQAIRPAVVNRKVWGGSRTQHGAEAQGRLASVLRTCWQRGLHTLDFLAQTLRAPPGTAPQLLPTAS